MLCGKTSVKQNFADLHKHNVKNLVGLSCSALNLMRYWEKPLLYFVALNSAAQNALSVFGGCDRILHPYEYLNVFNISVKETRSYYQTNNQSEQREVMHIEKRLQKQLQNTIRYIFKHLCNFIWSNEFLRCITIPPVKAREASLRTYDKVGSRASTVGQDRSRFHWTGGARAARPGYYVPCCPLQCTLRVPWSGID